MKKFWFLLPCLALSFSTAKAQPLNSSQLSLQNPTEQNLLLNGDFKSGLSSWEVVNNQIARFSVADFTAENGVVSKAFHVDLNVTPQSKPWDATLHQPLPFIFKAGEQVVLTGKVRSPQNLNFYAYLEESNPPYGKQASIKMPLTADWQKFEACGALTRDFAPNELRVGFQLASGNGSIEIADLNLTRSAADPKVISTNALLARNGNFEETLGNSWVATARVPVKSSIIDLKNEDTGPASTGLRKALKIELDSPEIANLWEARVAPPKPSVAIKKGDMILVEFWGRSERKNRVSPVFQQAKAPYDKSLIEVSYLLPKWRHFVYYAPAISDFAPGESSFEIQVGGVKGSIELTGIRVENLGAISANEARAKFGPNTTDYFGGETPNDDWKPAALARIEKYRKGNIEVRVVDGNGKPLPYAQVNIIQTRQAFRFGTVVNSWLLKDEPDAERYRAQVKRLFNTAVLENDMKWRLTDQNSEVKQRGIDTVKWLRDNGLEVRGHNMLWGSWRYSPPRLEKLSPEELRAEIKKHIFEVAAQFQGQVYVWDVVNEAVTNTEIFDKAGWDLFPQVFKWAREADKNARLAYNDYDISNEGFDGGRHREKVEARIQQLMDAGAPVDILGDQAHMFTPFTPMPRMLKIWDSWEKKYKKPLEITEFDAAISDDAIQEKYVRDYMTAAFSQPNIESFIFWGFWEKAHWRGGSGSLYRADWTPRPAALAVEDLILNQWRTNVTLSTDSKGKLRTRGFLGDYGIRVNANGKVVTSTAKVTKSGLNETIVVN